MCQTMTSWLQTELKAMLEGIESCLSDEGNMYRPLWDLPRASGFFREEPCK